MICEYCNEIEAFDIEQEIHRRNSHNRYIGEKVLLSGNTELFTEEIDYTGVAKLVETQGT